MKVTAVEVTTRTYTLELSEEEASRLKRLAYYTETIPAVLGLQGQDPDAIERFLISLHKALNAAGVSYAERI